MNMMTTITAAPTATTEWDVAHAAYLNAKRIEDEFDARFLDRPTDAVTPTAWRVCERIVDARHNAEDVLMQIKAPDLAGLALKFEIWFDDGEPRSPAWGQMIRDEIRGLGAGVAL